MNREIKQWWSTIPIISTTTSNHPYIIENTHEQSPLTLISLKTHTNNHLSPLYHWKHTRTITSHPYIIENTKAEPRHVYTNKQTLENTEGATGLKCTIQRNRHTGCTRRRKTKQKHNTLCVGHNYMRWAQLYA